LYTGLTHYVNGIKLDNLSSLNQTITTQSTNSLEPVTATQGVNYIKPMIIQAAVTDQGGLGTPDIVSESVEETFQKMQSFKLWDVKLTQEEIYQAFKDGPDSSNTPQSGSLLDELDFANPNLVGYTIPNSGSKADGTLTDTNIGTTWATIVADGGIVNW
jgi:hypothetical protein